MQIGTKYSWMNLGHSNFHAAVGFELGVPTGNVEKGLGEGNLEYEPYVVVAKDFPRLSGLQIFSQFGVTFARHVKGPIIADEHEAGKSIEWNNGMFVPYRKVRFTSEFNWSKSAAENSLYFTPGLVWKLPRNLEFGAGVPIGVTRDTDRFRSYRETRLRIRRSQPLERRFIGSLSGVCNPLLDSAFQPKNPP